MYIISLWTLSLCLPFILSLYCHRAEIFSGSFLALILSRLQIHFKRLDFNGKNFLPPPPPPPPIRYEITHFTLSNRQELVHGPCEILSVFLRCGEIPAWPSPDITYLMGRYKNPTCDRCCEPYMQTCTHTVNTYTHAHTHTHSKSRCFIQVLVKGYAVWFEV